MRLCVIGEDARLCEYCKSALENLAAGDWEVISSRSRAEPPPADFYVWDFIPDSFPLSPRADVFTRALFVVDPKDLESFRTKVGAMRASIVLKPARPDTLQPFLEHTVRQANHRELDSSGFSVNRQIIRSIRRSLSA